MRRRDLLQTLSLAGLLGMSPAQFAQAAKLASDWRTAFAKALADDPWLVGWADPGVERFDAPHLEIDGQIPAALRGTFYRNGPGGHERGGARYQHWFDGDGMVQALRFTDDGVSHLGRFVATSKRARESAAKRFLYPAFGTMPPDSEPISSPDAINPANINVVAHGGELLALWEAGSAYRLDPQTLKTLGIKTWRDDLQGMPFSAHPKIEPDGTLWNFGLSLNGGGLVIYRIDRVGDLQNVAVVPVGDVGMLHDVAISERHLIFLLQPLIFERDRLAAGASFLDSHVWRPERATRVLTVDKDDLSITKWYELPAGFLFHFGNAWEEPSGVIRFDYCRYDDPSLMTETLRDVMRGERLAAPRGHTVVVTLDPVKGMTREDRLPLAVEFPRVDPRVVARRHRNLYSLVATEERRVAGFGFDAVMRRDMESGDVELYRYGDPFLVEEHIVVPHPNATREGSGWVMGTALDVERQISVVSVIDALNLSAGPIMTAKLPYALPLGFHGNFGRF